jgi:hypothetical protein
MGLSVPRGRQRVAAAQEDDNHGAGGQQPAGHPRRDPRPGPAVPQTPVSASQRGTRPLRDGPPLRNGPPPRDGPPTRLDGTEFGQQPARARPPARLLGQAAADQSAQSGGQAVELSRAVDQPVHQQGVRPGTERPSSSSREHQHRTQAEDVARRPGVLPQRLLRRPEPGRPRNHAAPPHPEVDHPRPVLGQHDVRGIQMPVHQARGVQRAQAGGQRGGQRQHDVGGHRPPVADRIGQRRPGDVRRGQPRHRSVQIRVDHRRREGAVYRPARRDLGPEPGIGGPVGPHGRNRDALPARRTPQEQSAVAQPPEQLVRPERARPVSRRWRHHPDPYSVFIKVRVRQETRRPPSPAPNALHVAVRAIPAVMSGNASLRRDLRTCTRRRARTTRPQPRSRWPAPRDPI